MRQDRAPGSFGMPRSGDRMTLMARIWMMIVATFALAMNVFAQDGTYRLKPDDILRIQVYNEAQIQALTPVGRDGNISAPFLGAVRAQGLTVSELQKELERRFETELKLRSPKVSITIERYREVRASVAGMVGRPNTYVLRPGDTVLTLLSQAGSYVPDRSDLKRATLRRGGSNELIPLDLQALLQGDLSQNYVLDDGDELVVPEDTRNTLVVEGAVNFPNQFVYREGMRLSDALALARGDVSGRSKKSEILILREKQGAPGQFYRIKANYVRFQNNNDFQQNVLLQRGDVVIVPFNKNPDINQLGSLLNSAFLIDRFVKDGFLGFRIFR